MNRPLRIITSGAQAAAIEALLPLYGEPVEIAFGSSLGAAHDSIPTRLAEGQRFDIYFLAESGHRRYADKGYLDQAFIPLVESRIGAGRAQSGVAEGGIGRPCRQRQRHLPLGARLSGAGHRGAEGVHRARSLQSG